MSHKHCPQFIKTQPQRVHQNTAPKVPKSCEPLHELPFSESLLMSQAETREIALKFQDISQPFQCLSLFLFGCYTFATPWTAARQTSVSFTISLGLLKFMPIESVMLSDHLNLCRPLPLQYFLHLCIGRWILYQ